jgi:hypothetical protein
MRSVNPYGVCYDFRKLINNHKWGVLQLFHTVNKSLVFPQITLINAELTENISAQISVICGEKYT